CREIFLADANVTVNQFSKFRANGSACKPTSPDPFGRSLSENSLHCALFNTFPYEGRRVYYHWVGNHYSSRIVCMVQRFNDLGFTEKLTQILWNHSWSCLLI